MRKIIPLVLFLAATSFSAFALEGSIGIHDPSTVIKCEGNYYVCGTGRGVSFLVSSNGFDWQRGGRAFENIPDSVKSYVPKNNGSGVWAPDIIKVGDQYYVYYAVSSWGSFVSAIGLMTGPTLNASSPDYKWTDRGMVVHSSEGEALNAIDPGVTLAPDGTLWICYGSYHGNIELVQLDPKTGLRIKPDSKVSVISSQSEAADIIYHEGFFYLFVNHGSCCQGANSTYNIRVGQSKVITGPYLDRYAANMLGGGGTLFLAAQGNDIGPGHFGLLQDDGVEKFSCHYEAEIGRNGRSILDIRPLLWTLDGWPLPGDNLKDGTYQIRSLRTGNNLQASTATNGITSVLTARYLARDTQRWMVTPAGGGCYKILNAQSTNALTAVETGMSMAAFTGADNQLWKLDQLSDGTYRVESKMDKLALAALAGEGQGNKTSLKPFNGEDTQHWVITAP